MTTEVATSKGPQFGVLALKVPVLSFCFASMIILATTTVTVPADPLTGDPETKIRFKDLLAYRYTFSVSVIGFVYALIQIPIAALSISKERKIISKELFPIFIFIDVVIGSMLASGAGAGFGLTVDLKRVFDKTTRYLIFLGYNLGDNLADDIDKALDLAHASTGFILLAALSTILAVLISLFALAKN